MKPYTKVIRTINSCVNVKQLKTAENMVDLYLKTTEDEWDAFHLAVHLDHHRQKLLPETA
jgi:hypothetical protein